MTYDEHVRTGFLPTIIDEYVIMTTHAENLQTYLVSDEGRNDHENRYYYERMLGVIDVYRQFLSRA